MARAAQCDEVGDCVRLTDRPRDNVVNVKPLADSSKRGIHGVYHHASPKHLHRYVGEFAFRLGDGDVKNHTLHRLDRMFAAAIGQRLTYKELIA